MAAGGYTMQEFANCFDGHYATVSQDVRQNKVDGNV